MKKKLLLLAFLAFFSFKSFAQATAYEVDGLTQCMNEVFDLTVLTPAALGNQNPSQYTVTYFTSQADAVANTNPIATPTAFIINGSFVEQALYLRVQNIATGEFDTSGFVISMQTSVNVPEFDDVVTCGSFILPVIEWPALYYTAPNMGGDQLANGAVITTSQTIYIHAVNGVCNDESSFTVNITGNGPTIFQPNPLVECDENGDGTETFNVQAIADAIAQTAGVLAVTVHETFEDAQNGTNAIPNLAAYTNVEWLQQVLYIRVESANCESVIPLQLIVFECETANSFSGHVRFDADGDGCDNSDTPAAGVWVYYMHNGNTHYAYTDANGYYEFNNVPDGISYAGIYGPNSAYVSDIDTMTITFPGNDPIDNDFCLTIPEPVQDVLVYMFPVTNAVAGFDATYLVSIYNVGTLPASGTVTVQFDAAHLTFLPSAGFTQSGNTLTLTYSNLQPFGSQYHYFYVTVAAPPALNAGDLLTFTTTITPVTGDANPADNVYVTNQYVSNSFDPNDISVREGEFITEAEADGYLHYMVRFQNTGNYQATNIRVESMLDANLDWDTFTPIGASHNYRASRTNNNNIQFLFEGINLPDSTSNEAGSHGYALYKIKPKATVQLGDSMSAQAGIYFDFNMAVITNTVTTTIQALSTQTFEANTFVVYPNPANGRVSLMLQNAASANVTVTDILGKTVLTSAINGTKGSLDINHLTPGVYFITLRAEGKQITKKLVVK